MAEKLTPQQEAAVFDRGGKLLVSAAAGSGKTKVLVDRLLSYICDPVDPANIDDFLIITYTKAAASELRGKIAAKLTERMAQMPGNRHMQQQMQRLYLTKISTVHSFCSDVLRDYAYRLDLPADFRVAEETECLQLQIRVMEQVLEQAYENIAANRELQVFLDSQGLGRDDRQIPDIILKVYNSARCHLDPDGWLDWCATSAQIDTSSDASKTPWGEYLIRDLHAYLDMQIHAMSQCRDLAAATDGMEKPAALLSDTVHQLQRLRACDTWDGIVDNKVIDFGRLTFPKSCTDLIEKSKIAAVRDECKSGLKKKLAVFTDLSQQVLADLEITGCAARGLIQLVRAFSRGYEMRKKQHRVLDFGDLEHKMLDLLLGKKRSGPTSLAQELGDRYREIMVDEYQDTNEVQDAIFSAMTHWRNHCFMVGDVKQSIYQFRLADPGIFIKKYNSFVHAEDADRGQSRKVLLSSNFRSAGAVVNAVNDVFSFCMSQQVGGLDYGEEEMLREGIPHETLAEPEIELYGIDVQEDTYAEEAAFTADRICQLLDGTHYVRSAEGLRPITADDIVILLRSPGSVGNEFVCALEDRGIHCTVAGGSADLLQTEEVSTLYALLQVINNPLQDIPLVATLSSRVFGFTADKLAAIRAKNRKISFYNALKLEPDQETQDFLDMLQQFRLEARLRNTSQLIEFIFAKTRMDSVYAAMQDGAVRTDNLQEFCQTVTACENTGRRELGQLLDHIDAISQKGLSVNSDQKIAGAVTIMSIHKSKGLEFPVVFLCGLSRSFNQESAHAQVLCDKDLGLGLSYVDSHQRVRYPSIAKRAISAKTVTSGISEELRVLYVAMTRPKDRLIMTYASKNLEKKLSELALRMDLSSRALMTSDVSCPGEWVLQTALTKTEAGEFFALGCKPNSTNISDHPWLIKAVCGYADVAVETVREQEVATASSMPAGIVDKMQHSLNFHYAHLPATEAPSKQTATQLKGRFKDQEVAEDTQEHKRYVRSWRSPSFLQTPAAGTEYGNAMHSVMQYIRFEHCSNPAMVKEEVERLHRDGYISQQQLQLVNCEQIAAFFKTDLGNRIQNSNHVLREFKFSILDNGNKYIPDMENENILLQGVVDCALIEADGITVVDFKTDRVTSDNLAQIADNYRMQVKAYADALERIYQLPVKSTELYFFRMNEFVSII